MDSLTQACLGAAVGGTLLGHRLGRKAVLVGAALGTLPDLDVVIDYGDAVAEYTYHRGFSHSLLVLTGLATLLAVTTSRLAKATAISLRRWWLFYAACLLTHPLLDVFTTYGTQVWWPFPAQPVSWASIFIIDPLYTLPLLITVLFVLVRGHGFRALHWGLALSTAYLLFSLSAKGLIELRTAPLLADRNLENAPRLVQPTPFNTLLWRVTVIDDDEYLEGLTGLFDTKPPTLERFPRGEDLQETALKLENGQRLRWFAGPFLRYSTQQNDSATELVVTDLRLGFPGFHPFNFSIAKRSHDQWQATAAELVPGRQADRNVLARLFERAITPDLAICPSAFSQATRSAGPGTCP